MKTPSEFPLGIQRVSEMEQIDYSAHAAVARKLLHTREVRQLLRTLLPEVLNVYAGKSRFKKFVARRVGNHLSRSLSRSGDIFDPREIQQLFENEQFVENLLAPLPDLVNGLFDILSTAVTTIEELDTREKTKLFGDLMGRMANGQTGSLITSGCRILNDIHRADPEFFAKNLEPGFKKWIESVDFGEVKEMVENSASDVRAFVTMANDTIWQYPAKVVLLLSLLPSMANMLTDSADISLSRLNKMAPDLLTDVILSFINEIETAPVAGLVNELSELVRKIHTGSGLLGEPGTPQLPRVLSAKIDQIIEQTDAVALWKAKMALAETGASIDTALTDAVNNTPALKQLALIKGPEITNIRVKTKNRKLAWWDGLDDEAVAKSASQNLSAYDLQEAAEVVNNTLRLFNRVAEQKPELFAGLVRQFVNGIDDYELAEAARHLYTEIGEEIKPAARAVVPGVVTWLCDVLKPADDAHEDDAAQAREALQALFASEEV